MDKRVSVVSSFFVQMNVEGLASRTWLGLWGSAKSLKHGWKDTISRRQQHWNCTSVTTTGVTRLCVYDEKCFLLLSLNIDNVGQWPEGPTNPREMGDKPMRHGILRDTLAATQ